MSGPPEEGRHALAWVEKAEHDLQAGELILREGDEAFHDTACFHAQQSVEKYLKALLTHLNVEFPYTHDIRVLLQRVNSRMTLDIDIASLIALNRYAIQTRYPGDPEPIYRAETMEAITSARKLRKVVRAAMKDLLAE
jgi:HEPN domain-containing protein